MTSLRVVILDDEQDSIALLKLQLERHCPEVGHITSYTNSRLALPDIEMHRPDLLFLDIEMPGMNGFEFLEKISPVDFGVIFTTAYNQYAIKAFRFNALDYLLKPIDIDDLVNAVHKAKDLVPDKTQLKMMQKHMQGERISKIAISSQSGVSFIDLSEIIYTEANNNYSRFVLTDGKTFTASRTLKDVQEVLENSHFLRIHRQYIINLNHVKHFNRNDCILTMINTAELPVARNQKEKLIQKYGLL